MNEYRMYEIDENNCISTDLSKIIEKPAKITWKIAQVVKKLFGNN